MQRRSHAFRLAVSVTVFITITFVQTAHAYLDPGTGSFALQLLLSGFLGGLFALKLFWKRVALLLRSLFSREKDS